MKTKILVDFHTCISVPLTCYEIIELLLIYNVSSSKIKKASEKNKRRYILEIKDFYFI